MELSIIPWQVFLTLPLSENPSIYSATLYICRESTKKRRNQMWCGALRARGLTYEGRAAAKTAIGSIELGRPKTQAQA